MGVLDEILEKAKTVATVVSNKTGEIYEVSKLKLQAVSLNAEIQKCYERLGRMTYDDERTGEADTDMIEICIAEITDLLEALDEINEMINEGTPGAQTIRCINCLAILPVDSIYCAKCGMKLGQEESNTAKLLKMNEPNEPYISDDEPFDSDDEVI